MRQLVKIPESVMAQFETNADAWAKDPALILPFLKRQALIQIQIAAYFASNPPAGRQGGSIQTRMLHTFHTLGSALLESIKKLEGPPDAEQTQQVVGRSRGATRSVKGGGAPGSAAR